MKLAKCFLRGLRGRFFDGVWRHRILWSNPTTESKDEKIKLIMIANVIRAAIESQLITSGAANFTSEIFNTLQKAKTTGGIANKAAESTDIDINYNYKELLFLKLVQQYNKETGIFSGRVENLKGGDATNFGLKTAFLPKDIVSFFETRKDLSLDGDVLNYCKGVCGDISRRLKSKLLQQWRD